SAAVLPAILPALAPLFTRRISSAFLISPAASTKAFLHSIIPKLVISRSSATIFAVIFDIIFNSYYYPKKQVVSLYYNTDSRLRGNDTAVILLTLYLYFLLEQLQALLRLLLLV